jgi:long-chain fatty acid transport protein
VTDWLDVGAAVDAQYTDAKLATASPNLSPVLPDGVTQLSGDGWNWGWALGAQARFDRLSLGASYRSAMDHDLDGQVFVGGLLGPLAAGNVTAPGSASFTTPWIATVGARYRLTDRLTLDGQVQRLGWGEFDAIRVSTGGGTQILAQDYKDTTSGGVGVDYRANDRLTLRAGVQYDPTPTPDGNRSARVPDGDRWLYGVGATGRLNDRLQLDAALAYIDFSDSTVSHDSVFYAGTPAAVTTRLRGHVEASGYILAVGVRGEF